MEEFGPLCHCFCSCVWGFGPKYEVILILKVRDFEVPNSFWSLEECGFSGPKCGFCAKRRGFCGTVFVPLSITPYF